MAGDRQAPADSTEASGVLQRTVLATGKDSLARAYVSFTCKTPRGWLDFGALFASRG